MTTIKLPWPPRELSPNSRADRRSASAKRAKYRWDGHMAAKAAKVAVPAEARLVVTFYPPDNRRRDLDNMLSSIKVGLDGIATASGVDDRGWTFDLRRGHRIRGGLVTVEVA